MKCSLCGERMRRAKVSVPLERGSKLLFIRDVPAYRCSRCGEIWLEDEIAARLEEIFNAAIKNGVELELAHFTPAPTWN